MEPSRLGSEADMEAYCLSEINFWDKFTPDILLINMLPGLLHLREQHLHFGPRDKAGVLCKSWRKREAKAGS